MTPAKVVTVARAPRAPRSLGPEGREFWRAVAGPLTQLGIMDPRLDVIMLELAATGYELWRRAVREAAEKATPATAALYRENVADFADDLVQLLREFLLTPAARDELRQALEDPQVQAEEEFLRLLRQARRHTWPTAPEAGANE